MYYVAKLSKEGAQTVIEFPDCPGCATFAEKGEDIGTVAQEALEVWLAEHLSGGEAPPRPDPEQQTRFSLTQRVYPTPSLSIALQIRWRRHELQLSQGDLGRALGVTRQQVAALENPDGNLRLSTLERVAEALDVELSILLRPMVQSKRMNALI